MKTGIKRERESNRVRGGNIQAEQGWGRGEGGRGEGGVCLLNSPQKRTSEEGERERAGAMVGWAGRAWKTATSHRHRTSQERPSQTDRQKESHRL